MRANLRRRGVDASYVVVVKILVPQRSTADDSNRTQTIHRLLEVDPKGGGFKRGDDNHSTVTCWSSIAMAASANAVTNWCGRYFGARVRSDHP